MLDLKFSKEDFGYLVVFPDGSIDLYRDSAAGVFETARTKADLAPHQLERLKIGPGFHLKRPLIV